MTEQEDVQNADKPPSMQHMTDKQITIFIITCRKTSAVQLLSNKCIFSFYEKSSDLKSVDILKIRL